MKLKVIPEAQFRTQRRTDFDVFRVVALNHHVGLADGIGFIVYFLSVQVNVPSCLNLPFFVFDKILRFRQDHPNHRQGRKWSSRWKYVLHGIKNYMD